MNEPKTLPWQKEVKSPQTRIMLTQMSWFHEFFVPCPLRDSLVFWGCFEARSGKTIVERIGESRNYCLTNSIPLQVLFPSVACWVRDLVDGPFSSPEIFRFKSEFVVQSAEKKFVHS